jgi:23S rRNA (uracil1939-C5)-methyltransferase
MQEEIVVEKMVFGGDCMGKTGGKTIFVPSAIPGEKIRVQVVEERKDFLRGKITEILSPSVHRVKPFCPYYGICGGCNMQHISGNFQKELRASILAESFAREKISLPRIQVISGAEKGYRARFQFHDGGLMGKKSGSVVQIENCPCATEEINSYLSETKFEHRPKGRIHVFGDRRICAEKKIVIAPEEIPQKAHEIPRKKKRYEGTVENPLCSCEVEICGKKIAFDVRGFFQSNLEILEKTVPLATDGRGKNALDLYSGSGVFSRFISENFFRTVMVEHNKSAVVFAERNLAGKNHESYGVSGEVWTKYHAENCMKKSGAFDFALADPPRSGMEKSVANFLCGSKIPVIKSLSCNPSTQARDIKILLRGGYRIKNVFLLDFYPQTSHIESLVELEL